ncbi:hypothetical protein ABTB22_19530, partial [Acinetobacter baumannii]
WWISSVVRSEREHACDDIAVELIGDRTIYAEALYKMEQVRAAPSLAMSANRGSLLNRIQRLASSRPHRPVAASGWITLVLFLSISLTL